MAVLRLMEMLRLLPTEELLGALLPQHGEKMVTGGVRSGKSTDGALEIVCHRRFFEAPWAREPGQGVPLYWLVSETYSGTDSEMDYVYAWCQILGIVKQASMPQNDVRRIETITGAIIETRSGQHPERLQGAAPDLILVCEAGKTSEAVRRELIARSLQKRAPIIYTGTLAEAAKYAWYERLAVEWERPTPAHGSYRLPSWANAKLFPGGRNDPSILEAEQRLYVGGDPKTAEYLFLRMYAGVPSGVMHPVYPEMAAGDNRLFPVPKDMEWLTSVGGMDFGTTHPSTLVVVSLSTEQVSFAGTVKRELDHNVAWVRECWTDEGGRGHPQEIEEEMRRLRAKYGARAWATDPNEKYAARSWGAVAVDGGAGSRGERIGWVRGRLQLGTLRFDRDGPGVAALVDEMKMVHYREMADGELRLVRDRDDRTAALENANWLMDSRGRPPPARASVRYPHQAGSGPRWRSA